jgi:integrase
MASIAKRPGGRWRARYRDDTGKELVQILAAHVAARCPGTDPGRWLFGFGSDVPPHHNGAWGWWRKARKAAGCGEVKLHSLRHYYASGLIAAGCDVVTVQRALGHGSATVTLSTYAHLWPTAEDRTRAAAASMMAETLNAADSVRTSGQR